MTKAKIIGIGGIFFKAKDPKRLMAWYQKHLGISPEFDYGTSFHHKNLSDKHYTVLGIFKETTTYFKPSKKDFMINFCVNHLDELLNTLRKNGVNVDDKTEQSEYGKFGWVMDPEGNRIELWEPPQNKKL